QAVLHDPAAAQRNLAVGLIGQVVVVRDQQQRRAVDAVEREQEIENTLAVLLIEIACRLVGQQYLGLVRERARDGHALLFTARKLRRVMMRPVTQADFVEQRPRAAAGLGDAHDLHRREDVFVGRERGDQVERLKDEADQPAAQLGQFVLGHSGDLAPAQTDAARSRRVESGDQAEQRRFAATRRADDRDELTARYD